MKSRSIMTSSRLAVGAFLNNAKKCQAATVGQDLREKVPCRRQAIVKTEQEQLTTENPVNASKRAQWDQVTSRQTG